MLSRRQTIRLAVLLGLVLALGRIVQGVTATAPTEPALLPSEDDGPPKRQNSAWYFNSHSAKQRTQYLGAQEGE